ncbi:MAG: GNAT family N-acetyltransferase [Alphaproteobacteria bacterium]
MTGLGFGLFAGTNLRGVGLLDPLEWSWPATASAWLSIEKPYQRRGAGGELLARLLTAAQNRGIGSVFVLCLENNPAMGDMARRFAGTTHDFGEDQEARFDLEGPTAHSLAFEVYAEANAWFHAWRFAAPSWMDAVWP